MEKICAIEAGGKFAAGVIDTGRAPWLVNISANFWKKFEMVLMEYSGAGGETDSWKNQKQKISQHCPIKNFGSAGEKTLKGQTIFLVL